MLYLLDSSIYIFRGWQKLSVETQNRLGQTDNAVQGFTETLCHIIENHNPELMVCAFDECFRQGVRNRLYPPYKADRPPAPEELAPQFARCKSVAAAFGIPTIGSDSVEADDVVGHFATMAQAQQQPVTIISGDKDLAQFVGEQDRYWDYGRHPIAGYKEVCSRFKIRPDQIADWLALSGDKSDNIPGVPGVGSSTAAKLLNKWENLDALLANLGEVANMRFRGAPRISRLLYEHKADIHLARSLTGLIHDDRLPASLDACKRQLVSETDLVTHLYDIGFNEDLAKRISTRVCKQQGESKPNEPA